MISAGRTLSDRAALDLTVEFDLQYRGLRDYGIKKPGRDDV